MLRFVIVGLVLTLMPPPSSEAADPPLKGVRRVLFLGDSITYAGQYVEYVEAYLRAKDPDLRVEFLDLGLPSETVSGLSEPGHANGAFLRPTLHERLDRVLALTKPDLIVACYGMNDGMYYPFAEDRFAAFQKGILLLRDKASTAGARVVHLTPPVFDPEPIREKTLPAGLAEYRKPYVGYDDVLARYSAWLLACRGDGSDVVDLHGPMAGALARVRTRDAAFTFAADGVHANAAGHWLIARQVLKHWGVPSADLPEDSSGDDVIAALPHGVEVLKLVRERQRLLKDAYLTAAGHKRPGMARGLALDDAKAKAMQIEERLARVQGKN